MMENMIYLLVIILFYTVISFLWNIFKVKNKGGEFFASFSHRSTTKISGLLVAIIGSLINIFLFDILPSLVFQIILVIIFLRAFQRIKVYANGIYFNGYYVPWEKISSVRDRGDSKIEIKYGL